MTRGELESWLINLYDSKTREEFLSPVLSKLCELEQRAIMAEGVVEDYAVNLNKCREQIQALEKVEAAAKEFCDEPTGVPPDQINVEAIVKIEIAIHESDKLRQESSCSLPLPSDAT